MELHDMPAFAQVMIDLGELYYQSLSETLIELYWATLKCFDIAAIRHAVDTHIHNPDVGQSMPTPTDIVCCLENSATTNMLSSYYTPPIFIAQETGIPFEVASKALRRGFEGPSKPRAGTGARTRAGTGAGNILVAQARPCSSHSPHDVITMFEYWKAHLEHPPAKLDDKRKKPFHQAFKSSYSVEQLCEAITGYSLTPHNRGHNDILRDANQIDRFIYNARSPPKPSVH
jgi:hypothetical protein